MAFAKYGCCLINMDMLWVHCTNIFFMCLRIELRTSKTWWSILLFLEAYGNIPAFLCCWIFTFVGIPSALAALSVKMSSYIVMPFEIREEYIDVVVKGTAAGLVTLSAVINVLSISSTSRLQIMRGFTDLCSIVCYVNRNLSGNKWKLQEYTRIYCHGPLSLH